MAVRFILGRAGSGKTHHCIERLRELERAGRPACYLVPEQATYSADRQLLEGSDLPGIRHVRVLSFSRLAQWIRERAGAPAPPVIADAVRPMLLRVVLDRLSDAELGPLVAVRRRLGALEQLSRFIAEVRNHGATDFVGRVHRALGAGGGEERSAPGSSASPGRSAPGRSAPERNATEWNASERNAPGRSATEWNAPGWSDPAWNAPGWKAPGSSDPEWKAPGWNKVAALARIFEHYDALLRDLGGMDPEQRLHGLEPLVVEQAREWAETPFYVDGFLSWTRREREVMVALARTGAPMELALCCDPVDPMEPHATAGDSGSVRARVHPEDSSDRVETVRDADARGEKRDPVDATRLPFHPVYRSLETVQRAMEAAGVRVDPPVEPHRAGPGRFAGTPSLQTLEACLYAGSSDAIPGAPAGRKHRASSPIRAAGDEVLPETPSDADTRARTEALDSSDIAQARIWELASRRDEVRAWARAIDQWTRLAETPTPYASVAVLVRDLEPYRDLVREIFPVYGVPFFLDERRNVLAHPTARLLLHALEVPGGGWRRDAVISLLRNPLLGLAPDAIDRLENLSRALGRDFEAWYQSFAWEGTGETVDLDEIRYQVLLPLRDLERAWTQESFSGARAVEELRELLVRITHPTPAHALDAFEDWGARVEDRVAGLLSELAAVWSDLPVSIDEFARVFRDGLLSLRLGVTPARLDQVIVGDVQRSRVEGIERAIIGGCNERTFPREVLDDPVLGEVERASLAEVGLTLGPTAEEQQEEEAYLFYISVTRASQELLLTYPASGGRGEALAPSHLLEEVVRCLPETKVERPGVEPTRLPPDALQTPRELSARMLQVLAEERATVRSPDEDESVVLSAYRLLSGREATSAADWLSARDRPAGPAQDWLSARDRPAGPAHPRSGEPFPEDPRSGDPVTEDPRSGEPVTEDLRSGDPVTAHPRSGDPFPEDARSGERSAGSASAARLRSVDPDRALDLIERARAGLIEGRPAELPEHLTALAFPGPDLTTSVSRLEEFASCPFRSFAGNILRLRPRPEAVVTPLETGNLAHAALESFFEAPLDELLREHSSDKEEVRNRLARVFDDLEQRPDFHAFQIDEANRYRWRSTRSALSRFLDVELRRLANSPYHIHGREIPFGPKHGNAVELPLDEGVRLLLRGRIDRLDLRESPEGRPLALVVDYKRSARQGLLRKLERGLDLQLAVYLLFARDIARFDLTGGLYLPVVPGPALAERTTATNPAALRAHGLVLAEERDAVDGSTGLLPSRSQQQLVENRDALDSLLSVGRFYLQSYARTMRRGLVVPRPLEAEADRLPCANCDHLAVCRFRRGRDPVRHGALQGFGS